MADTKISEAEAETVTAGTDEFGCNRAGSSKKMTLAQITARAVPISWIVSSGDL